MIIAKAKEVARRRVEVDVDASKAILRRGDVSLPRKQGAAWDSAHIGYGQSIQLKVWIAKSRAREKLRNRQSIRNCQLRETINLLRRDPRPIDNAGLPTIAPAEIPELIPVAPAKIGVRAAVLDAVDDRVRLRHDSVELIRQIIERVHAKDFFGNVGAAFLADRRALAGDRPAQSVVIEGPPAAFLDGQPVEIEVDRREQLHVVADRRLDECILHLRSGDRQSGHRKPTTGNPTSEISTSHDVSNSP